MFRYIAARRGNDKVINAILDYRPIRVSQGGREAILVDIDYADKEGTLRVERNLTDY